jgi:hypothetical protein
MAIAVIATAIYNRLLPEKDSQQSMAIASVL